MDHFETPYDEEAEFILCTVCDKSIRGDSLYKIHLTTPGHIKKEDALVAAGLAVRQHVIPVFEDILQYLDYVKLDEPIIGLNYLEEEPCKDLQAGLKYSCRLCHQTANLAEMVHHVIGRKHRQKYLELKRPDLVTWDKQSIMTQGGKIIRAKAEIIERQDGRGTPVLQPKSGIQSKFNISRVPPKQRQNRDQNFSQTLTQPNVPSQLADFQNEFSRRVSVPSGPNTPRFHLQDSQVLNRDRQTYQREITLNRDRMGLDRSRADYRGGDVQRQEFEYETQYEDKYVEDPQRGGPLEPGGAPRYDSEADMTHGQPQYIDYHPEETPSHSRTYPERDILKEFYSEEVRRGRVRSEFQTSQPPYSKGNNQRVSLDRETSRADSYERAVRQSSNEPEAKRSSFSSPVDSDWSHMYGATRDYTTTEPHEEAAVGNPRPSRAGPPTSQRQMEVIRSMSDIPEPFRRFLTGGTDVEGHGKRKRKSRFSDATVEEVESTREMFGDEYGPPNPKFGGHPRPVSAPSRPEIRETLHPDLYTESQGPRHTESYQRDDCESEGVFDMLKNIEIENAEEADFLKKKLCDLLKEFKSKKAAQASSHRAVISEDYNSRKRDPELPPRHRYESMHSEDSDLRQPEDFCFQDDDREKGWNQHEHVPEEQVHEYSHPLRRELRPAGSSRSRYEEVFGHPERPLTLQGTNQDDPARYPGSMRSCNYGPAAEEFLDSSAPPLQMERGPGMERVPNTDRVPRMDRGLGMDRGPNMNRGPSMDRGPLNRGPSMNRLPNIDRGPMMDRGPRYSNNLDKITSTLLELVARK